MSETPPCAPLSTPCRSSLLACSVCICPRLLYTSNDHARNANTKAVGHGDYPLSTLEEESSDCLPNTSKLEHVLLEASDAVEGRATCGKNRMAQSVLGGRLERSRQQLFTVHEGHGNKLWGLNPGQQQLLTTKAYPTERHDAPIISPGSLDEFNDPNMRYGLYARSGLSFVTRFQATTIHVNAL